MKRSLFAALAIAVSACGGSSSPAAPTTPPPTPPAQTALVFTGETTAPVPNSVWIKTESGNNRSFDPLRLSIMANDIRVPVNRFDATLRFDKNVVLAADTFKGGAFLEQGGALTTFSVHFDNDDGEYSITIERPDTLPGAIGSGELIVLLFHPAPNVHNVTSSLQWNDTELDTENFDDVLTGLYAGSIRVE